MGSGLSLLVAGLFGRDGIPVRTGSWGIAVGGPWSNFLVRSLTLGWRAALFSLLGPVVLEGSIGAETDLVAVRRPLRAVGMGGCLAVVPLPFDRKEAGSLGRGTDVAMGARSDEEEGCRLCWWW